MKATLQTKTSSSAPSVFTPVRRGLLQRKCACGGTPGFGGEYQACRDEDPQTEKTGDLPQMRAPSLRADHSKLSESGPGGETEEVTKNAAKLASEQDEQAVQAELGAGSPLDSNVRSRMESFFGHDFSRVRVQAGPAAAGLAASLSARAFTLGSDIAFAAGEYHPGTPVGDKLLTHELAHVVQQEGATAPHRPPSNGDGEYNTLEADAEQSSTLAMMWSKTGTRAGDAAMTRKALPQLRTGLSLQRQPAGAGKAAPPAPNAKLKSGPTYSPNGTIKATKSGGMKNAAFDLSAEFENDANTGAEASCGEVRQYILWTAGDPPNHAGFKPATSYKANTWYEDRDGVGKRYGHRTGTYSECVGINHYEDAAAKKDCAKGAIYKGKDTPLGADSRTGEWCFQLKAIDTCNGGKEIGTAASVKVSWDV
jgi:hypothetical protein